MLVIIIHMVEIARLLITLYRNLLARDTIVIVALINRILDNDSYA